MGTIFGNAAMAILLIGAVGCRLEPAKMPITERDTLVYRETKLSASGDETEIVTASQRPVEEALPLAILMSEATSEDEVTAYKAMDSALSSALSDFAFFTVVERSNVAMLQMESLLTGEAEAGDSAVFDEADYLVTAKILNVRWSPGVVSTNDQQSFEASVEVDFRFYEKPTKRTILVKTTRGESSGSTPNPRSPQAASLVADAAARAANSFAADLGARFAPEARVVETRGEGKVALITMGTNYGLSPNTRIEFYKYVDNSDVIEGAHREPSPVAYGVVLSVERDRAWVEVKGHKEVEVRRGHYARPSAVQSLGTKDSITQIFRGL